MCDADIGAIERAFVANEQDARVLASGLDERQGTWRAGPDTWSVAECLDHLAISNRVYLSAMQPSAEHALAQGLGRRGPAVPGMVGRWFVWSLEPPVKSVFKIRAPARIQPRTSPPLRHALEQFLSSHREVVTFLRAYAAIDLAGVLFPNPLIKGVRLSLATGLHVVAAHERRHLWQAWRVRRAVEETGTVAQIS